jgi:S1-C subfamily serine protease
MNHPSRPFRAVAFLVGALVFALPVFADDASGKNPPAPASAPAPAAPANVDNSVVKIFATMRYPDPFKPWTKQAPTEATGTGVVIEGKRILTNAHVALYASQIQIQANQSGEKLPATIEYLAAGIDLAVLKLEDESFFDTHPALARAQKLPNVKDSVMVYGYPTGGSSLSITKGIVSRIEFAGYNYPVSGLRIQIDAAINPGNSGGPALAGDEMIGVAFSRLGNADNIGYIIPCEEIELFLKDIADGRYDGKPMIYDSLQTLENPALRSWLKLPKATEGIVVAQPESTDATHPLKPWDVITHIGDTPIDNQGMIKVGDNLRLGFGYLIQKIARNGHVPLTVARAGNTVAVDMPVAVNRPQLIPDMLGDYPSYFVYGPVVFSVASSQFLAPLSGNARAVAILEAIGSPLATRRGDKPAFAGEQLVVVASPFFPHRLAKGYDNPISRVVAKVNGTAIKNLAHLVTVLRDTKDEFVVIEFAGRGIESIVLPRAEVIADTEDILSDNGVRSQGSPDTLLIWNEKPAAGKK